MSATDRTDTLLRAARGIDDAALAATLDVQLREELLARVVTEPRPGPATARADAVPVRRRARRVVAWTAGLSLVAATAAAGYGAWLRLHPDQNTTVTCQVRPDAYSVPATSSGDPVADCTAQWRLEFAGTPVPDLAAFVSDRGEIVVRPAGWPVPEGWRALPAGFRLDTAVLAAERALTDQLHGLADRCLDEQAAERWALAELADRGLTGWRVDWRREFGGRADGKALCGRGYALDPEHRKVILGADHPVAEDDPESQDLPYVKFPAELRRTLTGCQDRATALAAVRRAAVAAGIPQDEYQVQEVDQPADRCAWVTLAVGGGFVIQISGGA